MRKLLLALGTLTFALFVACSGKSDIGSSCATTGSTTECVDGAVCSKTLQGAQTCQKICNDQKDCPTGTTCNGLSGSVKSCRPDT